MESVPDFIILKDVYDRSRLKWSPGERFKCLINNCYYYGKVIKCTPFSTDMPKSLWQNYVVEWDNKEEDNRYVSPWDIQTTDSKENIEGMQTIQTYTACDQQKLFKVISLCIATLSILYNTVDCLHFTRAIAIFHGLCKFTFIRKLYIFDKSHVSITICLLS